ncbi:MAG TPA: hypothetical protein EYN01_08345 [Chromatiales bacterium]|nr:hypothetical protein [Chromatiales bacterium]
MEGVITPLPCVIFMSANWLKHISSAPRKPLLDTDLDHKQREFVDTINDVGNSLLAIINDILDFSKRDTGKIELDVTALVTSKANDASLEIILDYDYTCPRWLVGDAGRIPVRS